MNEIKIKVNFEKRTCVVKGVNLTSGDYASTKLVFDFDRQDGTKIFEMNDTEGNLLYVSEIENNELVLLAKKDITTVHNEVTYTKYLDGNNDTYWYDPENEELYTDEWVEVVSFDIADYTKQTKNASLFNEAGKYSFEISLYENDSKLTSASGNLPVKQSQVEVDDDYVELYLPVFDQLMQDIEDKIDEADSKITIIDGKITEANNLNLDMTDTSGVVEATITKKDGTTKTVEVIDRNDYYDKDEVDSIKTTIEGEIPTKVSQLQNDSAFIDKNVNNLTNYTLATGTGSTIELSINSSTYVMTMNLKNSAGTVISTGSVDLPLESVVVSGSYDSTNKKIILTLQSGSTIEIPVGDLVSGLQPEITSNNKLSSDLVDDTNKTNKFVSASEKTTWNAKYDKPSGGIPSTDMSSAVQTSLEKADTALQEHQDISGKEDKTNKVTSISSASTDTQYPSAKCVYDSQEEQNGLIDNALSIYNALPKVSGTGEELTLDDTAECWIPEIELKSNKKQESTSGKNLALTNNTYASEYPNCTVIRNDDNTLTINGTLDALKYPVLVNVSSINIPAGDYTLSVYDNAGNQYNADLNWFDSNDTSHYVYKGSSAKTFTASDIITKFTIQPYLPGTTYNNVILYIQLEQGSTATDYESYTGGIPSPNPNYQQDIHVVTGDNEIKLQNKNLVNSVETNKGVKTTGEIIIPVDNSDLGVEDYIAVKPNTTYAISFEHDKTGSGLFVGFFDVNKNFIRRTAYSSARTFTTPENSYYAFPYLYNETPFTTTGGWVQLELGTQATSYVEHKEQTYSITLGDLEACKIGDYEDKFIKATNETGLTAGKWYLKKNIGKVVLDGSEDISIYVTPDETRRIFAISNILNGVEGYTSHFDIPRLLSNYFYAVSQNATWPAGVMSRRKQAQYDLYISVSANPSVDEIKNWLSTHNTIVYYPLATPTYTLLNDTLQSQLEAIKNAMSYQDQTNISQVNDDAPFVIKLSAVYDLNKLVSRVATLETE